VEELVEFLQEAPAPPLAPEFSRAADKAVAKLRTSLDRLLEKPEARPWSAKEVREIVTSALPGPVCLYPYEIEDYSRTGKLNPEREAHVQSCPACAAVLKVSRNLAQEDEAALARWELLAALTAARGDRS
jgi:hypothetical protein